MLTAESIADAIEATVSLFAKGKITHEMCSAQTKCLWDIARKLGLEGHVDQILQSR